MPQELYFEELGLEPGVRITVKGYIRPETDLFRVDLGTDEDNIALHFNPRFNFAGDYNIIVCNTKTLGTWDCELRVKNFPYVPASSMTVEITFTEENFKVRLHNEHEFSFPNRHNYRRIDFMMIIGIDILRVDFE